MFGVLFVELEDFAGVAVEVVDELALVAFVDGPIDLVAGLELAAAEVSELMGDRESGAVGVPGEARQGEREIVFRVGDDVEVRRNIAGEPEDVFAVAGKGESGLEGHVAIEVEFDSLARLEALAVVVSKFTDHLQWAAAFVVS
ncbi:MAG: hypothetical protein B7Z53_01150 [Rhodospirillales bacterium 12-71-4]|nr:MAG: hypothetical protein B7Z53_01150 [Rhodospirillales bacterium 12-71-4]